MCHKLTETLSISLGLASTSSKNFISILYLKKYKVHYEKPEVNQALAALPIRIHKIF